MIERISAVTLFTREMPVAFRFYDSLGFQLHYGGVAASFTTFSLGENFLNIELEPGYAPSHWGRIIFYVSDVDEMFAQVRRLGLEPSTTPRDAEWGERYFHITDPDGHELSFARRLG